MSRSVVLPLLFVGLGACGGDAGPGLRQVPDATGLDVAVSDAVPEDGADDGNAPPADVDVVPSDALAPDARLAEGGAACGGDAECASGRCLLAQSGRVCAFSCALSGCPDGLECRVSGGALLCVDRFVALCLPCRAHADCRIGEAAGLAADDGSLCLAGGSGAAGRFCGVACGERVGECPEGYRCEGGQCQPSAGECRCSGVAVTLEAATACGAVAGDDICTGERRCVTVGDVASACDATPPEPERCNGRDDDCDGETDERPLAPGCDGFVCLGADGCAASCADNAACEPGLACDSEDRDGDMRRDECVATGADGTACDEPGDCDSGYCDNDRCCTNDGATPTCCAEDADCVGLDEAPTCTGVSPEGCSGSQRVGRCQAAICVTVEVATAAGCLGQVCSQARCLTSATHEGAHLCDAGGACVPTADATCDDGEACTFDTCSAEVGCQSIARSGAIEARCYGADPATRGVGACKDGFTTCEGGLPSGCIGELGPAAERCNGADDDCDGATDEDGDMECLPYPCGGADGCRASCEGDADCATGHFCDDGACRGTGEVGATCEDDGECQSGHCGGGVCCEAGLCCLSDGDCASLDDAICDVATADGCAGTRLVGLCGEGSMCVTEAREDASVCSGQVCEGAACSGATLVPEALCEGAACVRGAAEECSPYACTGGACGTRCATGADCSGGASCVNELCVSLPDGSACTLAEECRSGHCENGFCCAGPGLCCGGDDSACAALDEAPVCVDAGKCGGTHEVGVCGADFRCAVETVEAPEACLGETCGPSRCTNLEGGELVLEGRRIKTCSATGICVESVRDCRDNEATSYCTRTSALFPSCQDCAADRQTCVVFDNPCYCE